MKLRLFSGVVVGALCLGAGAQQPGGAREALANMATQPSTHTAFTFDKDLLGVAEGYIGDGANTAAARNAVAAIQSVTVETFHYHQPAFYVPERFAALVASYDRAGWKHLVNQNASPREQSSPTHPLTDLWLHFHGAEIDDVVVLVRGTKDMNLIEVSGTLRPLDLVHLSGHFGIPKVDPDAVMVPAKPGR